jgi:hypothetical protein
MSYGMRQDRFAKIRCNMHGDMPYRAAAAFAPGPRDTVARISATISAVSLWARAGLVMAWRTPRALACALFCRGVLHSRFSTRLFFLSPSLWFTQGRLGAGGRNAFATSRCAKSQLALPFTYKVNSTYPLLLILGFSIIGWSPVVEGEIVRTAPQSLISYLGNPSTGFQVSILRSPGRNRKWDCTIPLDRKASFGN